MNEPLKSFLVLFTCVFLIWIFLVSTGLVRLFVPLGIVLVLAMATIRITWAVGLLSFAIALSPEIDVASIPIRIEDIVLPIIVFFWFTRHTAQRQALKPTRALFPILVFLFFMAAATVHGIIVNPGLDAVTATFHFLKHVEYLVIFGLTLNVVSDREDVQFLLYCLLGAASLVALQSVMYPAGIFTPPGVTSAAEALREAGSNIRRISGVVTETANIFGGFLVFHVLLALGMALESKRNLTSLVLWGLAVLLTYPIVFTLSRSSYTGLVMGLAFLGLVREPRILLGLILSPILILSIMPPAVIDRIFTVFQALAEAELVSSWNARLQAWAEYLPVIVRNPFLGKGLFYIPPGEVDNELVLRGVETGVLGALSFVWLFASFFRRAYVLFRDAAEAIDRQIGLGYAAGLVGLIFHSLAATSFTSIRTAEPLYFTSGLVVASYLLFHNISSQHSTVDIRRRENRHWHTRRRTPSPRNASPGGTT